MFLPPSHFIVGSQSELSVGARRKAMIMLVLFGLIAVDLLPLSPTLVPLQLVLSDRSSIVGRDIPAKSEVIFCPNTDLGRVRLGWSEGGDR